MWYPQLASRPAVFRTDGWGNPVSVNSSWIELTGLTLELIRSGGWLLAVCLPERQGVLCQWRHALETQQGFRAVFRIASTRGRTRWVSGQIDVELGKGGRVLGFFGVISLLEQRGAPEHTFRYFADSAALLPPREPVRQTITASS
jgi:PAS domain-containing protein